MTLEFDMILIIQYIIDSSTEKMSFRGCDPSLSIALLPSEPRSIIKYLLNVIGPVEFTLACIGSEHNTCIVTQKSHHKAASTTIKQNMIYFALI